jgi:hypothetical protein
MAGWLLLLSNLLSAQPDSLERRPSVGEHVFTPVTYSRLPFTNTYFSTFMGFGQTTDLIHKLNLIEGVDLRGLRGELTFLDFGFYYQQRVRDWLGAYVNINVSARVGTELQSILSQGINTINSFNIGWHIKLVEREKIAISTFAELQNFQGSFISVTVFLRDILAGVPNPSISENIPVLSGGSGFRFAYGINDLIGLKLSTDLVYGESFERGENKFTYTAGGGIDFDFFPRYDVPLGLVLNYSISTHASLVVTTDKNAQIFHGKIAYTGGQDFSLGIEYFYQKIPLPNIEEIPTVNAIALAARYYF